MDIHEIWIRLLTAGLRELTEGDSEMAYKASKYIPYGGDGGHGMQMFEARNALDYMAGKGKLINSVMLYAHTNVETLATPLPGFLSGYQYQFDIGIDLDRDESPDWFIDIRIFDNDGSLKGAKMEIDSNPGSGYVRQWLTFNNNTSAFEGKVNGRFVSVEVEKTGVNEWSAHIDQEVMHDVVGAGWNGEGKFGFEVYNDGISSYNEFTLIDTPNDPIGLVA